MQRIKRLIAVSFMIALVLFTPGLGVSELRINSDLWLDVSENELSDLRFSGLDSSQADTTTGDDSYDTDLASSIEMGYWLENMPWLGVTSETSLMGNDETRSKISIDADTDFDPLNSFILFRYQEGPLQPFVGVGPTLIFTSFASKNIDSVHHLFMGLHYSF